MPENRGAEMLRDWLAGEGRSQELLAELIGVRQTTVSIWTGRAEPKIEYALKLEAVTGIPLTAWFDRFEKPKKRKAA